MGTAAKGSIQPYIAIEYQQDSRLLDEYFRKNFSERGSTLEMIIDQFYQQESDHLEFLLEKVGGSNILTKGITTVLCRLFEKYLENGFNRASFESLTFFSIRKPCVIFLPNNAKTTVERSGRPSGMEILSPRKKVGKRFFLRKTSSFPAQWPSVQGIMSGGYRDLGKSGAIP